MSYAVNFKLRTLEWCPGNEFNISAPVCHSGQSEQRERSGGISDSIARQRDAGTGFFVREALHH
jgi:hypothetical protein